MDHCLGWAGHDWWGRVTPHSTVRWNGWMQQRLDETLGEKQRWGFPPQFSGCWSARAQLISQTLSSSWQTTWVRKFSWNNVQWNFLSRRQWCWVEQPKFANITLGLTCRGGSHPGLSLHPPHLLTLQSCPLNRWTVQIWSSAAESMSKGVYPYKFGFQRGFGPNMPEGLPLNLDLLPKLLQDQG